MTLRDDIRTALGQVPVLLGETWSYRRLTSAPGVEPRTYSGVADLIGHQSSRVHNEAFQDHHGAWVREERCGFRVADDTVELTQGDQLCDVTGICWAIVGIPSTGVGTRRYDLSRTVPLYAEGSSRNGGV